MLYYKILGALPKVYRIWKGKGILMGKRHKFYLSLCILAMLVLGGCAGGGAAEGSGKPEEEEAVGSQTEGSAGQEAGEDSAADSDGASAKVVFEGQDLEGNAVSSDIFSDTKLTMVNVWATYCNPCLSEMPGLGELAGEYDSGDFRIIGIVSDVQEGAGEEGVELATYLVEQTGADYPHLLLNESLYYGLLTDVSAVPTTFFIDGEGNILDTVVGAQDKAGWKEKIDGLLEER